MPVKKIKLPDSSVIDINDSRIHIYRTLTGTAADTTTPYNHAKWDVTDSTITEYVDGMVVCLKVPVAGHGTYGTGFQINNLGYKPVVYNVNSMVSTRYGVGSVIWCVYNATQTGSLYINSTAAVTVTGCWQVQDYDANTNTIGYQLRTNSSTRPVSSTTYRYRLMFSSLDNSKWVPATNSTSTNATSARTVNQEVINPWGRIVYYSTTTARSANQSLSNTAQWDRYTFNFGYSFNTGSALDLTFPGPVYIKCTPQAGGGAIIDSTTPYTQSLPSSADGKIYIYLGQAYSASEVELIDCHPVLYHDGTKIALWTDTKGFSGDYNDLTNKPTIPDAVSGVNDGTNWTSITIGSTTKAIPQGGSSTLSDLTDTTITTPSDGQVLAYNSVSGKFENSDVADGLPSQSGQSGKFLTTNGSEAFWDDIPEGAVELSALTDVSLTDLSANQMLKYNAISQKWENVNIPSDAFICTLTFTEVDGVTTYSCDKTIAEIVEANNNDKVVILKCVSDDTDFNIQLLAAENNNVIFFTIFQVFGLHIIIVEGSSDGNTDGWSISTHTFSSVAITGEYNDLLNKPTLGTASALDVAESGNASTTQVVKGDDTRLSDSRNAADVYPWAKAATKPSYTASEVGAIPSTDKGANGGVAELDSNGKVPSSQLPSYVDDVLEYASVSAFPATGESGKIYIALDTNKTYRWGGSTYVEISESLALGETASTAYAGNKGKDNADAIAAIKDGTTIDSFADVETALHTALGDKISKSSTAGLVKNDGTIDTDTYLTSHDFTHVADTIVTTSTTITFAANTRGSQMVSTAADLDIAFVVNNSADNYLWIKNTGSADIDITISSVTYNTTALTDVYIPDGGISVPAGKVCEIGIVCNADGAFITSRNDLTL